MYALVDCNNFYASCERVFNPNLQNKPVAILSNNDGCVIARSNEAKALGLPMGAPIFKWQKFCKTHNIEVLSSNYPLYGDMSSRVMTILEEFSPEVEIYSIDEAFLGLKGFENYDFKDYGDKIRKRLLKWTGIPTCVGIAPTKALSKVANKIAKKFPKETNGVYVIDSEEKRIKALKWTKIESVWGIGRRLQKRLNAKGCKTAFDFTQLTDDDVRKTFSITQWRLKKDLEGDSKIVLEVPKNKQVMATTRSFEHPYSDLDDIKERVSTFATICAEKLRKQGSSCRAIYVMLGSDRYQKDSEQYHASRIVSFAYPTDSSLTISKEAVRVVTTIFKEGIKYKRAGVVVMDLVASDNYQLDIFEHENPKHKSLMMAIDGLNKKYKDPKIKLGNQDLKRRWKMRQERLSPRYTTNINDVIKVKC